MERIILLVIVVAVIGGGVLAGVAFLSGELISGPYTPGYETIDGECQIRVYDDPLWAEHYAKNVNLPNCTAYKIQNEANKTRAESDQINWNTEQAKIGVFTILFVVCLILALLAVAIVRG